MKVVGWVVIIFLAGSSAVSAQVDKSVADQSLIIFKIRNFGAVVEGRFPELSSKIRFHPDSLLTSYFNISVDASKVNTGIGLRDRHLQNEDYFAVKSYPELMFSSAKISSTPVANTFILTGDIVIKGIAKRLTFPFTMEKMGNEYLCLAKFNVNRKDFSVGGNHFFMGDDVEVNVKLRVLQN